MRENNKIKVLMVVVPLIIAFFSVFVVSGIASSVEFHACSPATPPPPSPRSWPT